MDLREFVSGKVGVDHLLAFVFGVVFVLIILILALVARELTAFQIFAFRLVLALAAAGIGAVIPGMLGIILSPNTKMQIRAAGAFAVFLIVYLLNPAQLAAQ